MNRFGNRFLTEVWACAIVNLGFPQGSNVPALYTMNIHVLVHGVMLSAMRFTNAQRPDGETDLSILNYVASLEFGTRGTGGPWEGFFRSADVVHVKWNFLVTAVVLLGATLQIHDMRIMFTILQHSVACNEFLRVTDYTVVGGSEIV